MARDEGHDVIIVSDLHLSEGYDPRTGTYHRNEDFFYDAAFARFLDNLRVRAEKESRKWRLVVLGDLFDFLQIETEPHQRERQETDTSGNEAIGKLDRIAEGHPEFFEALGRFVAAGFALDIVPGNHDIELVQPPVQEHFKKLVVELCHQPEAAFDVTFHPWIYYIPGVLYAEHGQQYDDANSFHRPLRPYVPGSSDQIDMPLGSYFVEYLFNRIESFDPFADNWRPMNRYLWWSFRVHPILALSTLGQYLRFLITVLTHTSDLSRQEQAERQAAYREEALRPFAEELGLSFKTVVAIDRLSATPAMSSKLRLLRALVVEPLLPSLPFAGGLVALYAWIRKVRFNLGSLILFAAGLLGLAWRERRLLSRSTQPFGYLHRASLAIHRLLRAERKGVSIYVFGHTHTAEQFPLGIGDRAPRYLNSGTWTPVVMATSDLLGARERFTFVQITHDSRTGSHLARLLFWNDSAGRAEPLPLLMT